MGAWAVHCLNVRSGDSGVVFGAPRVPSPARHGCRQRTRVQGARNIGETPPGAAGAAHRLLLAPTPAAAAHPRPRTTTHFTRIACVSSSRRRDGHNRLLRRRCRLGLCVGARPQPWPVLRCRCFLLPSVAVCHVVVAARRVCFRTLLCGKRRTRHVPPQCTGQHTPRRAPASVAAAAATARFMGGSAACCAADIATRSEEGQQIACQRGARSLHHPVLCPISLPVCGAPQP